MNSYTVKLLVFFLSLFILITVSSQIYLAFQDTTKTQSAIAYTSVEAIPLKGIFVRDETVVQYTGSGVISYPYPDGSKIAKQSVVAEVYASENDILTNKKITSLTEEMELLKKAQNKGTTEVAQPEFLSGLIQEKYQQIAVSVENNDLENISSQRSELLTLLNIMQIVIQKETNYNDRINTLADQISALKATKSDPVEQIRIEDPGYFVSYTDGYEDKLTIDTLDTLSILQAKEILQSTTLTSSVDSSAIGKMIDSYRWKMVCILDNSKKLLTQGASVQLKISSEKEPIYVTVDSIKETENSKESMVVLACDNLTYSLVQYRVGSGELLLNNFEGIKVPREAIRFRDGVKGVYIKLGEEILFRKIEVIYEGDDYVLTSKTSRESYLMLYDDIVVEGVEAQSIIYTPDTSSETEAETQAEPSESSLEIVVGGTSSTTPKQTEKETGTSQSTNSGDEKKNGQ